MTVFAHLSPREQAETLDAAVLEHRIALRHAGSAESRRDQAIRTARQAGWGTGELARQTGLTPGQIEAITGDRNRRRAA